MRYAAIVASTVLLSATAFSSCTCGRQVDQPERPAGFPVALPKSTAAPRAQAPTPTMHPHQAPKEVAQAGQTPTPPAGVPDNFPKDVPIYKDAHLAAVQNLANDAHNVIFQTADSVPQIHQYYEDTLTHSGWSVTQQYQRANHSFMSFRKGKMIANVTVAEDPNNPGKQVIAIMYEEEKPLDFDEF